MDPSRGFLPSEDPLECLPQGFEIWERLAAQVPTLLMTNRLRETLATLTIPDLSRLESDRQLRRAMLLLSIFGNAYVWGGVKPATTIPRAIAIPWCQIAEKLGRPPITAYASIVLDNWRRIDRSQPLDLNNLAALELFWGGIDEQWFYLTTVAIEAKGAPALAAIVAAQKAVAMGWIEGIRPQLAQIAAAIIEMQRGLERMTEKCDPYIYYHRVRPFLAGWPETGVIYEGVSDLPQKFAGGSAAQSSLVQSLDAGLGIQHAGNTQSFLQEMHSYMSPRHRQFIVAIWSGPSIKQFIIDHQQSHPALCDLYNHCVEELMNFRKQHLAIAAQYILQQAPKEQRGTGGTNFVPFLKKVEAQTKANLISNVV
ncbi:MULTISPECIES: indoleamine 2,3-dioxygenase [unclassified Okeania]|uniref:indoleamine 2,3-dioxygenase n=1 Tax=unclassified Okeania TaxID=2634635 RepID=UPI00257DAC3C|nr:MULTISPECIES: indoleamine 2,3-dioxygenase [unclassified Okeania]